MQSPEPSEDDAVRVVSRASGGRSKAPFGAAVPQVQRLINAAIRKAMKEGTHLTTGPFKSLGRWADLDKWQKVTVVKEIWDVMREYALPAVPDPDTPIARGTSAEDASAQVLREWIMSEEEMKQERDAEGGGLRIPKQDIDKRKQYFTKLATGSVTRQPGRGKWSRAELQTEQGARPMEMLSEDDDAESDQGRTSSVPESGASLVGRSNTLKRGGPGRPIPTKDPSTDGCEEHVADEGRGAETESCQEEEMVTMAGRGMYEPPSEDDRGGDQSGHGDTDEDGDRRMEVDDEVKEDPEEVKEEPKESMAPPVPADGGESAAREGANLPDNDQAPIVPASLRGNRMKPH